MIYLDTGCLVKLYYPEPNSHLVATRVTGKVICYTALHDLELTNALHQKKFRNQATAAQIQAARGLIATDLASGQLQLVSFPWDALYQDALLLTEMHTASIGCRTLDILHCAQARRLGAADFISTDGRQIQIATAMGLPFTAL